MELICLINETALLPPKNSIFDDGSPDIPVIASASFLLLGGLLAGVFTRCVDGGALVELGVSLAFVRAMDSSTMGRSDGYAVAPMCISAPRFEARGEMAGYCGV
jgi:hypothetical protein